MNIIPLDIYDEMPRDMKHYLQYNGWHFNKASYEYAVSMMKKKSENENEKEEEMRPMSKKDVDSILESNGVSVKNKGNYDYIYVASMCMADFFGSSIEDEKHLALYVKDTCDDVDAPDGTTMRRWFATLTAKGVSVPWEEFL